MTYHKTLQRFLNVHNFPESGKGAPPDRILKNLCRCHCSRVVLQDSPSDQRRLLGMRSDGESLSLHNFWGIMASALISQFKSRNDILSIIGIICYHGMSMYHIMNVFCIFTCLYMLYTVVYLEALAESCVQKRRNTWQRYTCCLFLETSMSKCIILSMHFSEVKNQPQFANVNQKRKVSPNFHSPNKLKKKDRASTTCRKPFQIFSDCLLCHRTETSGLKDSPRPKAFRHFQCGTYNAIPTWPTTWGSLGTIAR